MATHDIDDIYKGSITHKIKDYPKASLVLKKDITVGEDDLVSITGNYTSEGSSDPDTILSGRVEDVDFLEIQEIKVNSKAEEIDNSPNDTYYGRMGGLIQELLDNELDHITHTYTKTPPYNYRAPHNFRHIATGGNPDPTFWTLYEPANTSISIEDFIGDHNNPVSIYMDGTGANFPYMRHNFAVALVDGGFELYFRAENDVGEVQFKFQDITNGGEFVIRWYGTTLFKSAAAGGWDNIGNFVVDTWYHYKVTYDVEAGKWYLWQDDVSKDGGGGYLFDTSGGTVEGFERIEIQGEEYGLECEYYFDAIGFTELNNYDYGVNKDKEYDQLDYFGKFQKWALNGDKKIRSFFDIYADSTLQIWYLKNDLEIKFNSGDTDSGIDLNSSYKIWGVKGKKQIKAYDKVILKGGYVGGDRIISISGAGSKVYTDTYANIQNKDILDDVADNLLTTKSEYPITISALYLRDISLGFIQPGEYITILAGIKFRKSSKTIPPNDYIIRQVKYFIKNGTYVKVGLILDDGLVFTQRVEENLPQENSDLIGQVSSPETGGTSVPNHNELEGLNDGTDYEHITQTQKTALHSVYTDAQAVAAINLDDTRLKNTTDSLNGNLVVTGSVICDSVVPDADNADACGSVAKTWLRVYTQDLYDSAGNQILGTDGAGNIDFVAPITGDLTVANIITAGLVDSVDVSDLKDAFDALDYYTQAQVDAAVATKCTTVEAVAAVAADDAYLKRADNDWGAITELTTPDGTEYLLVEEKKTLLYTALTDDAVANGSWTAAPLFSKITSVNAVVIECSETSTCIMELTSFTIPDGQVIEKIISKVYGRTSVEALDSASIAYSIGAGAPSSFGGLSLSDTGYGWGTEITWEGLALSQADLNALRMHIKNSSAGAGTTYIDYAGFEIYTGAIPGAKKILKTGNLKHNLLGGLNDGTDYEHITQAQKDALHWTDVAASNYYRTQNSIIMMKIGYTNANLQAAIDDLVDTYESGTIYLPTGDCTITTQILVDGSSINLIGSGIETKLINGLTADYIMDVTGNYCSISNLMIEASATSDHGIELTGSGNTVYKCLLDNTAHGNGNGIGVNGNKCCIYDCDISSFANGIYFGTAVQSSASCNSIVDTDIGIYDAGTSQNQYWANVFEAIDSYSIYIVSDYARCFGNTIGTGTGIYVHANSQWSSITGNMYPAISNNGTNTQIYGNSDY